MATTATKRIGKDLTQGNIFKTLIMFALPILLTNFVQQLYDTVDLIIIGQFAGNAGTVGVNTGGEIVNMLTNLGIGFASAGQVYISQLYGAGDMARIRKTIGTLMTTMMIVSLVFCASCLIFREQFLALINTPADALTEARNYMTITAFGLPFIYGYNAICNVLRGMGEAKRPLIFITIAAVSNIILDLLFVAVFKWAAAGTALATVLAQVISCVSALVFMYRRREQFGFEFKFSSFAIAGEQLKVLLRLGIPKAAQMGLINISMVYCSSRINLYGMIPSAVNSVGNKIVRFANIITNSIDQGAAAMVGQCLGARKQDRAKKVVYTALLFAGIMAVINCAISLAIPEAVFRIFSKEQGVIDAAANFMRIQVISFVLAAIMGPFLSMVTGSGNASLGFLVGILDGVVLRIGLSVLFAYVLDWGVNGFFYGNALARLAPCVISLWYFYSGAWKKRKLLTDK